MVIGSPDAQQTKLLFAVDCLRHSSIHGTRHHWHKSKIALTSQSCLPQSCAHAGCFAFAGCSAQGLSAMASMMLRTASTVLWPENRDQRDVTSPCLQPCNLSTREQNGHQLISIPANCNELSPSLGHHNHHWSAYRVYALSSWHRN
jgi:hypothetical protein